MLPMKMIQKRLSIVSRESLTIRIANKGDWQRIIEIYNQSVLERGKTADIEPISVEQRKDWLILHEQKKIPYPCCRNKLKNSGVV